MCFYPKINDYKKTTPLLNLKEFYSGSLKAHGVARNWRGKVVRKFQAEVSGLSTGDDLTLHEFFTYDDGRTFKRKWDIKEEKTARPDEYNFTGTGADIFGQIVGQSRGCAAHLFYTLKIPSKKSKKGFSTLTVDHRQYKIDETHTLHFLKLKKFGFTLINSTVMFTKV
ncbi:MAG: DUF3833 domain-containing protein [Alphaproteobacteria bacterium]|nr:DUF3833 domain-containing protein [Alphaproteobacteria bacterium]NCQ66345.1 DUF3833 domain-containing protein [Alphaproteobacteria bacterium]NCT06831.1 DUF3833 domain-containing protein [Alphaproteobacteria bacterium]